MNSQKSLIALSTLLIVSGRNIPKNGSRYLVLWSKGKGIVRNDKKEPIKEKKTSIGNILLKYGVDVEEYKYTTNVNGKKYTRYKLIIRDEKLTKKVAEIIDNKAKLSRLMNKFSDVVFDIISHTSKMTEWRPLLKVISITKLMKFFGIKPFNYGRYFVWKKHKIVKYMKPNWRGWLFKRLIIASGISYY